MAPGAWLGIHEQHAWLEPSSGESGDGCAKTLGPSSVVIGIAIALAASVGINLGQNLQALGLQSSPAAAKNPCSSKIWVVGLVIFITGSLLNFAAFSFAAASVVVPIEAVQFVTNVLFSKFVNKAVVTRRQWLGTSLAVLGTVFTCVFGPNGILFSGSHFDPSPHWYNDIGAGLMQTMIIQLVVRIFAAVDGPCS